MIPESIFVSIISRLKYIQNNFDSIAMIFLTLDSSGIYKVVIPKQKVTRFSCKVEKHTISNIVATFLSNNLSWNSTTGKRFSIKASSINTDKCLHFNIGLYENVPNIIRIHGFICSRELDPFDYISFSDQRFNNQVYVDFPPVTIFGKSEYDSITVES